MTIIEGLQFAFLETAIGVVGIVAVYVFAKLAFEVRKLSD